MNNAYLISGTPRHAWIVEQFLTEENQWYPVGIYMTNPGSDPVVSDHYRVRRATITAGKVEQ